MTEKTVEFSLDVGPAEHEVEVDIWAKVHMTGPTPDCPELDIGVLEVKVSQDGVPIEEDYWESLGLDELTLHEAICEEATHPPTAAERPGTFLHWILCHAPHGSAAAQVADKGLDRVWFDVPDEKLWIQAITFIREGRPSEEAETLAEAWREFERAPRPLSE